MREYKIAAIPADGIGPEVIAAGLQVLEALEQRSGDFRIHSETFDWGSDYYKKHGVMMPADGLENLKKFDAIFFGAVGAPDVPDHITLWGLRLPICQGFDQYANVRPTKILPGITPPLRNCGPGDLDWVIVRENSEGEYSGHGGRAHRGLPEEVGTEVAIFTRVGVTRIMRYAFKLAQERPRKSMFEPIHGSAFDITGKGIANPIATFWTAAQMLEHLGEREAAARLMSAVERVTEAGILTPDVGGTANTKQVTDAVCNAIAGSNII
ncbi:isocitrate/isopropylmalate family dehydrogenase [Rhizobium rhizogenes]|uniref:isocitrate/isopropylmalate family dehydrogenase n=1 Tax=Rhizobium rhizogenes TaxID=359 RepID=UPI0022CBA81C|nr:isocitrate/isopropylmalate family dehydrogenase [Rhizobium rhizogenes]MCZ7483764.1 isocitrate/isopropylmalate family dehydrogenase [Rhizobium rhizogenes]